jgi:hypothetical protein
MGKEEAEKYHIPLFLVNSKARDVGVTVVSLITVYLITHYFNLWVYVFTFGLSWGALSTYNKWFQRLFGYPADGVYLPAWIMTGFLYGIAFMPLYFASGHTLLGGVRLILLTILIPLLRENTANVWAEECGSGFLYNL